LSDNKKRPSPVQSGMKIAIDIDEVAADTVAKRLQRYQADYGEILSLDDIYGKQIRDCVPQERKLAVEKVLDEIGFSRDIPVMEDALWVMEELSQEFELLIATSAMDHPPSLYDRYVWLQKNFPFISDKNYIFCGSKQFVKADYLVDDNPNNLLLFSGEGILFDAHHNISNREYPRVGNWIDVKKYFLE